MLDPIVSTAEVVSRRPPLVAKNTRELKAGLVSLVPELRGRGMRLTANPALAEDLVQDTIVRALKFQAQYQRGTNLRAWVYTILFSIFITRCRRQKRERVCLRYLATDPNAWTQVRAEKPDQKLPLTKQTVASLDALPEVFREAITMIDLERRSYEDTAATLGVPVGTVMSRLHRGRKKLREALAA